MYYYYVYYYYYYYMCSIIIIIIIIIITCVLILLLLLLLFFLFKFKICIWLAQIMSTANQLNMINWIVLLLRLRSEVTKHRKLCRVDSDLLQVSDWLVDFSKLHKQWLHNSVSNDRQVIQETRVQT